ncbi:MAG: dienelactone hydrolase family protein [Proteobacteria bacterium]|nr:dienelactone hydrolase family protein [Pseudomonadota bacterium]
MDDFIKLTASDGHIFEAYRAEPDGDRKGGLVLIQEIFGVTPHIRSLCDHFAVLGYEVLAPAIFDRIKARVECGYTQGDIDTAIKYAGEMGVETPLLDIQACITELKARGPVAITGFCYGGSLTWMAACRLDGLACASGFYGRLIPDHLDETPKCPTMLHFGSRDKSIPIDAARRTAEAHPEVKVHLYRANHGFWSDRPANHDDEAIALSEARMFALFDKHMGG